MLEKTSVLLLTTPPPQPSTDQPTTADIEAVLNECCAGESFDPSEKPYCWDCVLYRGDQRAGEGQAGSAGKAMAYAWVHYWWPDAICSGLQSDYWAQAEVVPRLVTGEQWRFVLREPSPEVTQEMLSQ